MVEQLQLITSVLLGARLLGKIEELNRKSIVKYGFDGE